jgi:hypothetical protein
MKVNVTLSVVGVQAGLANSRAITHGVQESWHGAEAPLRRLRRRFDWRDRHFRESAVFFTATRLLLPMHGADAMRQQTNKRWARGPSLHTSGRFAPGNVFSGVG